MKQLLVVVLGWSVAAGFSACDGSKALSPLVVATAGTTGASGTTGVGGTTGVAGAGGSAAPVNTGAAGASVGEQPPIAACGATGDRYQPMTIEAVKQAIRGTWLLCSSSGLFQLEQDGLRVGADDRYVFLEYQNGALVPKTGLENKGRVEYLDTSVFNGPYSFQVNFVSDSGGTIITSLVLSDLPRQLIINNNGVETYTYGRSDVTTSGLPSGDPAPGAIKQPAADVPCGPLGERFVPGDEEATKQAMHGTWVLCSPVGLFRRPQAGIYIGPEDRWVLLERKNGQFVPKTGLENKGHLEYIAGGGQLNFVGDFGFTIIASPPIISDVPRLLQINNNGAEQYTYGLVR